MQDISIRHIRNGQILFNASCPDLRTCVETAIARGINLSYADLRYANLTNAQMDGAILDHADLGEANLTGANISEAQLKHTCFRNAQLQGVIFCESLLFCTDLRGAQCGGTDISAAQLIRCQFDTLSALDLNFRDSDLIKNCTFTNSDQTLYRFSKPPVVIKGLDYLMGCFDHYMMIGPVSIKHHDDINAPSPATCTRLQAFCQQHRFLIDALLGRIDIRPRRPTRMMA